MHVRAEVCFAIAPPTISPALHRLPTSTTTTMPFETDEAGRFRRAPLMSQHRCTGSWTDEAMDDADAIYTTTTHAHGLATLPPSSSTTSTTSTELLRHPLGLASSLLQASTSYYYDYNAVRDRRGRTTRAGAADAPAALHRLMDTDEAMTMPTPSTPPPSSCMENAKQRPKTTTMAA